MGQAKIPSGYRFRPTDIELLGFLALFVLGSLPFSWYPIMERNLYSGDEPWQLFGNSEERVRYFITKLKKKNPRNSRYRRSIGDGKGTWKAQDKGKAISRSGKIIGYKRSLRYENKGSEHDGQWLMKEYYFPDKVRENLEVRLLFSYLIFLHWTVLRFFVHLFTIMQRYSCLNKLSFVLVIIKKS